MGYRAMDHRLVKFVFKNVLFNRNSLLEIIDGEFAHVHNGSNIELINPVDDLIDA